MHGDEPESHFENLASGWVVRKTKELCRIVASLDLKCCQQITVDL